MDTWHISNDGRDMAENPTEDDRCWPCTVANATVGMIVALLPLVVAVIEGAPGVIALATVWAVAVTGFTVYRLIERGYLPFAEPVAKATGLHERIGPGSNPDHEEER